MANPKTKTQTEAPKTEAPKAPESDAPKTEPTKAEPFTFAHAGFNLNAESDAVEAFAKALGDKWKAKGVWYTMTYGFKQSLDDVIAGLKAAVMGTAKTASANWKDEDRDEAAVELGLVDAAGKPAYTREQLTEAVIKDRLAERYRDMIAGTVSTRQVGPRLTGLPKVTRTVTEEYYLAAVADFNAKMAKAGKPTKALPEKEEYRAALDSYYKANQAKIDTEAKRRFDDLTTAKAEETEDSALEALLFGSPKAEATKTEAEPKKDAA